MPAPRELPQQMPTPRAKSRDAEAPGWGQIVGANPRGCARAGEGVVMDEIDTCISFIGPLRSNDQFIHRNAIVLDWKALVNDRLTPNNHQKGRGLLTDLALVLSGPLQPETIDPV